jgi:hypothetical protein
VTRTGRRILLRVPIVIVVAAAAWGAAAGPALADPAGPTNYESTIDEVTPPSSVATFEVVGGDAFLQVTVAPGSTVEVPGYGGEPYIRIDADGSVWVNDDSPARYINEDRYAEVETPDDADGEGAPRWVEVADDGVYAWHDHRVHWMSRYLPPAVAGDRRQAVFPWSVRVTVDEIPTTITGELVWIPSRSPLVPVAVGAIALLPLAVPGWTRIRRLAGFAAVTAVIAAGVIIAENLATPPSARTAPVMLIFPLMSLAAAALAARRRSVAGLAPRHLVILAGAALLAWAISFVDVLTKPIVPSGVPTGAARSGVAFVLWAGAVIAVTGAYVAITRAGRDTPAR